MLDVTQSIVHFSAQFKALFYVGLQDVSRCANCWDNAPWESFFGHMKDEVDLPACTCFEQIHETIHTWASFISLVWPYRSVNTVVRKRIGVMFSVKPVSRLIRSHIFLSWA